MKERLLNTPLIYIARMLWRNAEGRRGHLLLHLTLSAGSMLFWLTTPLLLARLMNTAQTAAYEGQMRDCVLQIAGIVLLGILGWAFHGPSRVLESVTAFCARRNLQSELLMKVTRLPVKWHQEHHSGETIDRVGRASSALSDFARESFHALGVITRFVGSIVMLSFFMPKAGLYILGATAITLAAVLLFDRKLVPLYDQSNRQTNKVAAAVQDYLTNVTTVISLRLEDRVVEEVTNKMNRLRPLIRKTSVMNEVKWFTSNTLVDLTRASVLGAYVVSTIGAGSAIEIGTLYALNEYLMSLGQSFFNFTWRYGEWVLTATTLQAVEFISEDYEHEVARTAQASLPAGWRSLEIKDLQFSHSSGGGTGAGLHGVGLRLDRGKSYALVGESGSGKSTLLSLLRGLQQPSSIEVLCDGYPLPFGMAAVSHHTTLIPQEPEIFADTVLFNVSMGIEAPQEAIESALRMARFDGVLERLPRGLETNIAEKGVSLSGGEKQRLALARGLFFADDSRSEIILLDESTSSVDVTNERLIYESVLSHFRSKAIVSAVHKFNLLDLFDEIIIMERGKVIERGSLPELIARGGLFSQQWERYVRSTTGVRAFG